MSFIVTRPLLAPNDPRAVRLSGRGDAAIRSVALDSLASLLKLGRDRIEPLLEHAEVCDWGADPLSSGAYSYLLNGRMMGGFGVIAWPVRYGETGVMTFIISQSGDVYERDLGPETPLFWRLIGFALPTLLILGTLLWKLYGS